MVRVKDAFDCPVHHFLHFPETRLGEPTARGPIPTCAVFPGGPSTVVERVVVIAPKFANRTLIRLISPRHSVCRAPNVRHVDLKVNIVRDVGGGIGPPAIVEAA